jgi:hypothetical protein
MADTLIVDVYDVRNPQEQLFTAWHWRSVPGLGHTIQHKGQSYVVTDVVWIDRLAPRVYVQGEK